MQAPKGRYNSVLNCRVNMYIITKYYEAETRRGED